MRKSFWLIQQKFFGEMLRWKSLRQMMKTFEVTLRKSLHQSF